jgi:RNA polymerase subunit RPABC4/transcription elongation factor Spt4
MTKSTQNSSFKYLFWGLIFLVFIAIVGQVMWIVLRGFAPFPVLLGVDHHDVRTIMAPGSFARLVPLMIMTFFSFFIWVGVVGSLIYKDAKKRNMDPYLWACIAVFLPFLIGIVLYLVVRTNGRTVCDQCGKTIHSDYKVCPYCSQPRELLCPGCSKTITHEWKVCPYCEHKLEPNSE